MKQFPLFSCLLLTPTGCATYGGLGRIQRCWSGYWRSGTRCNLRCNWANDHFFSGNRAAGADRLLPADKKPNGLFTRVLLEEMQKPGITLDSMLRQVREKVVRLAKAVGHARIPARCDQTVSESFRAQ